MIQPVLAAAHIQGVAVRQEGLAAPLLHKIGHGFRPVGPQERQIARLTKMHLDGHKLILKVDLTHARRFHQAIELLLQIFTEIRPKVCPVNFRCHKLRSSSLVFYYFLFSSTCSSFLKSQHRLVRFFILSGVSVTILYNFSAFIVMASKLSLHQSS